MVLLQADRISANGQIDRDGCDGTTVVCMKQNTGDCSNPIVHTNIEEASTGLC